MSSYFSSFLKIFNIKRWLSFFAWFIWYLQRLIRLLNSHSFIHSAIHSFTIYAIINSICFTCYIFFSQMWQRSMLCVPIATESVVLWRVILLHECQQRTSRCIWRINNVALLSTVSLYQLSFCTMFRFSKRYYLWKNTARNLDLISALRHSLGQGLADVALGTFAIFA